MSKTTTQEKIKKISGTALFSTLAYLCVFVFRIRVEFLTFDIKDAIFAICGMVFGPVSAIVSSFLVSILEMVTVSGTGPYGLVMNFASSATFAFFASLIYKFRRKYSGAVMGLLAAVCGMTAVMMGMNLLVTPHYMGVSTAEVAAIIPTLLLPFNLTKAFFNAGISLLLYKPFSTALRAAKLTPPSSSSNPRVSYTVISTAAAIAIIAGAIVFCIFVLRGTVSFGR